MPTRSSRWVHALDRTQPSLPLTAHDLWRRACQWVEAPCEGSPLDVGQRHPGFEPWLGVLSTVGRLEGKVAIVTGSSSGIGEAIARRMSAEGASVVVNSSRSVDAGRAVATSLPSAIYVQADVARGGRRRVVGESSCRSVGPARSSCQQRRHDRDHPPC